MHRATTLLQDESLRREVFRHAVEEYPRECCGMILDSGALRKCENAIDRLHASDPESFPRSSANGYAFDFDDLRFIVESLASADPVRIVYHSHPDQDADFSTADREAAMPDGIAIYPQLAHLVIAVNGEAVSEAKLFAYVDGDYREVFQCPAVGISL